MAGARGEFSSRLGFILAASGSAVGLGNIWGFPTQAASNGGAAFLLVYLLLAFALAYPALMAELVIGRYAKANIVTALQQISGSATSRFIGTLTGFAGIITASLILAFYGIVAGWMIAYALAPITSLAGAEAATDWLTGFSTERNLLFMLIFMLMTTLIISGGVRNGIEKWSSRLMPVLIILLLALIAYVMTQPGAMTGLKVYLLPDFNRSIDFQLIVNALGQAFFSLSLGVGTMLIYGSYISKQENIASLGRTITLIDVGIAMLAGLLIIPAMYVAQHNGVEIFDAAGNLIAEDTLIFTVLPALFDTMGGTGVVVAFAFFVLMTIAALTSSISMLEAPVSYVNEALGLSRQWSTFLVAILITAVSALIVFNFSDLFILVINLTTRYAQPLLGLMLCLFAGWIWHRNQVLTEIKAGFERAEHSLFWKVWPLYIRYVCPLAITAVFVQKVIG
ncbi:MAG: sodium-dependent transporter [Pseudomonadales bacterium]